MEEKPQPKRRVHPAVPVVFVLIAGLTGLLFFVAIRFIPAWQVARFEHDVDISLPASEANSDSKSGEIEIVINVRKEGEIIINGSTVNKEQLLTQLKLISEKFPDQAVILRGEADTDFQYVMSVLDQVKKAGIWNVAFATTKPEATELDPDLP